MRPKLSVTGSPTFDVGAAALTGLRHAMSTVGFTMHSSEARVVWAVTQACTADSIPYEVCVAKDERGVVMGVAVRRSDRPVDLKTPTGWTIEVVEKSEPIRASASTDADDSRSP